MSVLIRNRKEVIIIASGKYDNLNNQEYWIQRSLEVASSKWKDIKVYEKELQRQYKVALQDIQNDLAGFITRYSTENNLTFAEATRQLNQFELGDYRQRMQALKRQVELTNNPYAIAEMERLVAQVQFTRLQGLISQVDSRLIELANSQQITIDEFLYKTFETTYYETGYSLAIGTGIGSKFTPLNSRAIRQAITHPWSGDMFSQLIWDNRNELVKQMRKTIVNGLIRGSSVQRMSRELSKKFNNAYKSSLRLIRTETAHVIESATAEAREEYEVKQYQIVATLDNRTSSTCQDLDGEIFNTKDRQVGVNYPPFHPNCRTTTISYFGRSYMFRRARGADGRNEVIPFMTYHEWKRKYAT